MKEGETVKKVEYDYSKLLGKIVEKCGTQGVFAARLGRSERTVSLKLNSKIPFNQDEMVRTAEVLEFEFCEIPVYFFSYKVQSD